MKMQTQIKNENQEKIKGQFTCSRTKRLFLSKFFKI